MPRKGKAAKAQEQVRQVIAKAQEAVRTAIDYDQNIAARICEMISDGIPLREICRMEGMPSYRAVYRWIASDPELASRFARARDIGYDQIADECLDIADNAANDWVEREQVNPRTKKVEMVRVVDQEHIQRSRLRIETRLKLLAKWSNKYSERHVLTGDANGAPIKVEGGGDHQRLLELIKNMEMRRRVADDAE